MEKLGQLIHLSVENKAWKPIVLGKNGPLLSHLYFANDLFLFAKVDIDQARNIKNELNIFGAASGHKVNELKNTIFFSDNIDLMFANDISSVLGFRQTKDLVGDVCQPLPNGGLGIRYLKDQNETFLLKLGFNLLADDQALLFGFKERILTNKERCRRGFADDHLCKLCRNAEESCLHVLRNCSFAKEVWK
ncbi:hypothetical protein J1N35_022441 [Gossypium stocksii]|uniref:Reverse transcriptase zinc-binding domain-containing protein n=1 Tax=Gossypium stocksii TaxID=47602 RepID=A0A9D3VGH4_9ROSI|nr:hypothetical protein J1N35_022441 [Gossypium stocksii]